MFIAYFNNLIKEKFLNLDNVGEVRSIGLINAIELVDDKKNKIHFNSTKKLKDIFKISISLPKYTFYVNRFKTSKRLLDPLETEGPHHNNHSW